MEEECTIDYDAIAAETDRAILFVIVQADDDDDSEKCWILKSQLLDHDESARTFTIPEWLANEKELI